jgi:hypothetical protein
MTPGAAKSKGRRAQQFVRDAILETFPSLTTDDVRSTSMGATGEDVTLSTAARKLLPYQIECKNKAKSQMHTWYEQAASHGDSEPLLVVHRDRGIYLATVSLNHFLKLMKIINSINKET